MIVDRESLIGRLHTALPRSAVASLYILFIHAAYYLPYSAFTAVRHLLQNGTHPWPAYAAAIGWAVWLWLFFLTLRGKLLPPILLLIYAVLQAAFFFYKASQAHWIFWPELTFKLVTVLALIVVLLHRRQIQICAEPATAT